MNTTDQFADIEDELKPKNKLYRLLLFSHLAFAFFLYGSLVIQMQKGDLRYMSIGQLAFMFSLCSLPAIALALLWFKKKAGWIIGLVFQSLIVIIMSIDIIIRIRDNWYKKPFGLVRLTSLLEIGMFVSSTAAFCIGLAPELRKYIRISSFMLTITLIIIGVLDAMMLFFIWRRL